MFKGKAAEHPSHRNPNIPAALISDELSEAIHGQRCFEENTSQLVKLCKRYEDGIIDLNRARLKLRNELLSLPLFTTRKDENNPEKQNFDARIDQFRRSQDFLYESGKNLVRETYKFHFFLFNKTCLQKDNFFGSVHDPFRKYMKMFPGLNEKIKHHEKCALDYAKVIVSRRKCLCYYL